MSGTGADRDAGFARRLTRPAFALPAAFLLLVALACAAGPLLPFDPVAQDRALGPAGPSAAHWLGTDVLGRDLLARLLQGGRVSLQVGLVATLVSVLIGVSYGVGAGWAGGRADAVMTSALDALNALPFTLLVILLTVVFGQDLLLIYAAVGAVSWLTMARVVRNETRSLRARPFIEAAVALGQTTPRILLRHVLPNLAGLVAVYATLTVPSVMLTEAFVSFLGLGVRPPLTSWGLLIKEGADAMEECPWLLVFPGAAFSATLLALNFLGDALRDLLDPRAAKP